MDFDLNQAYHLKYHPEFGYFHLASKDLQDHWLSSVAVAELLGITANYLTSKLSSIMGDHKPVPKTLPKNLKINVVSDEKIVPKRTSKTNYWSLSQVNRVLEAWIINDSRKSMLDYLPGAEYFAVSNLRGLEVQNDDEKVYLVIGYEDEDEDERATEQASSGSNDDHSGSDESDSGSDESGSDSNESNMDESDSEPNKSQSSANGNSSESNESSSNSHKVMHHPVAKAKAVEQGFFVSNTQYSSSSSVVSPEKAQVPVQQPIALSAPSPPEKPAVKRTLLDYLMSKRDPAIVPVTATDKKPSLRVGLNASLARKSAELKRKANAVASDPKPSPSKASKTQETSSPGKSISLSMSSNKVVELKEERLVCRCHPLLGHYFASNADYTIVYVSKALLRWALQIGVNEMKAVLDSDGSKLPKPKPDLTVEHLDGSNKSISEMLDVDDANTVLYNFYVEGISSLVQEVMPLIAPGLDIQFQNNNLVLKKINYD